MHFKNVVTIFCERHVAWFLCLYGLNYDAFVPFYTVKALKMEGNCDSVICDSEILRFEILRF